MAGSTRTIGTTTERAPEKRAPEKRAPEKKAPEKRALETIASETEVSAVLLLHEQDACLIANLGLVNQTLYISSSRPRTLAKVG